jgi:bifunctional DNA-binding transcriptional regulator/antitoxin component of YhaV-PrlF toxin-antitoxin module
VVIPAAIRERAGLTPGAQLEITEDEVGIRLERVALGPRLVKVGRRLVARPTVPAGDPPAVDIAAVIEEERNRWPQASFSTRAVLLEEEVFARMAVHDLPAKDRMAILRVAARDGIAGGRIYDAHIAEVARSVGAAVVVTDNRRHFLSALRYDMRVETPTEFLAGLKAKRV